MHWTSNELSRWFVLFNRGLKASRIPQLLECLLQIKIARTFPPKAKVK